MRCWIFDFWRVSGRTFFFFGCVMRCGCSERDSCSEERLVLPTRRSCSAGSPQTGVSCAVTPSPSSLLDAPLLQRHDHLLLRIPSPFLLLLLPSPFLLLLRRRRRHNLIAVHAGDIRPAHRARGQWTCVDFWCVVCGWVRLVVKEGSSRSRLSAERVEAEPRSRNDRGRVTVKAER